MGKGAGQLAEAVKARQLAEGGALEELQLYRRNIKGDLGRGGLTASGHPSLSQPQLDPWKTYRGEAAVGRSWQGIRGFRPSLCVPWGWRERRGGGARSYVSSLNFCVYYSSPFAAPRVR